LIAASPPPIVWCLRPHVSILCSVEVHLNSSKESFGSWDWSTPKWKKYSHERIDATHRDQVRVQPPKIPWTLKPLKRDKPSPPPAALIAARRASRRASTMADSFQQASLVEHSNKAAEIAHIKVGMPNNSKSMVNLGGFLSPVEQRRSPSDQLAFQETHVSDLETFGRIHAVHKDLLITAADPMGE